MSKGLQKTEINMNALEQLLVQGNLQGLDQQQRIQFINKICNLTGISPLLRPFDYISFQGKTVLYANRSATDQLRNLHQISIEITQRERIDGLYVVTAKAITGKGKTDEAIGAINIKGLGGDNLANALMKAETKAKRRVTLSITGLGLLDEIEAHEMAEREAKINADDKVERVEQKLVAPTPPAQAEAPADIGYVIKSGRNKGKPLSECKEKGLRDWLKIYDDKKSLKLETHPDLDEDAFYIRAHLDGLTLERGESPSVDSQPPNP